MSGAGIGCEVVEATATTFFLKMTTEKDYPGDVRRKALLDSRIYATSPRTTY